ncbi:MULTISPECIES: TetR/AcrR family transcriptional regulator [unclassified Streptomyces]|uniref:TetR/AcrR family transcriptional regulator n=1 Tax=unclassified Streptomyces TaxID=2593676 RepID=UPI002E3239A7|nr:TetR/AcrR family transcriptional regulator [Streptomyces sp. NBC_01268]
MGRPPDPDRRERVLAQATDHVLAEGLAGMSLRPLAAALGTSPRMLLYDFGSKQELVSAVLAEARRRDAERLVNDLPPGGADIEERLHGVWRWLSAPERVPLVRLFFEVHADLQAHPENYPDQAGAITDWFAPLRTVFADVATGNDDTATPTLVMAVMRGLLFDLATTNERERVDLALRQFAALFQAYKT